MNEMNNVVYGMINYGNVDISEGAKGSYEYIKNDIQDIKTRYIALGFHLSEFDRNEYYKEFGYSSLDSFVLANFNIDNKNLSRILSVYNKFGEPYKMFISEKYSSYSYSQLSEMVTLKEDDLKNINPAMTIRDIRDYKKSLKKEKLKRELYPSSGNSFSFILRAKRDYSFSAICLSWASIIFLTM